MSVPASGSEISDFFPPSFGNLEPRPTFRFRPASPRSQRIYAQRLKRAGLRYYSDVDVQAEAIRAMRALWIGNDDQLRANEARLTNFWETVKQAAKDTTVGVDPAEAEEISSALQRLSDNWPQLRSMDADNWLFNQDAPKIALGLFLCGWSGLETPFRLEDGEIPMATLDALENEVDRIEKKAIADKVEGVIGIGFTQLQVHALGLLDLEVDTEKNSPSPSSQSVTPDGSTTVGSEAKGETEPSESSPSQPATV